MRSYFLSGTVSLPLDQILSQGHMEFMSNSADLRVSDAPSNNWVYRILPQALWPYAQLARWDRPIGWWLLLWPCWWSLAMGLNVSLGENLADLDPLVGPLLIGIAFVLYLAFFMIGAIAMRGAGCTYNDLVDRNIDDKVARTASRPIPSGRVTAKQAWMFLVVQALVGALVLFQFNEFSVWLGIASLLVVAIYPFAKLVTDWPQFFLGLAFSWGGLMGWAVMRGSLDWPPLLLYGGSILWVIGYDTLYAHQDKDDDVLVGVRSTALLFGEKTKQALLSLYGGALLLFVFGYYLSELNWLAYFGLLGGAAHMGWQIKVVDIDDSDKCLRLFKSNSQFGWIVFAGLLGSAVIQII